MPADPDPQQLWQSQATEYDPMTLAVVHDKARKFQARIRRRNIIEYIACLFAALVFLPFALHSASWMLQVGAILLVATPALVAWQLHRRGSSRGVPPTGEPLVAFHRAELARQRDAVRSIGGWYLAPFVPGMVLMMAGRWFQLHARHRSIGEDHLVIILSCAIVALVFAVVWLTNQRAADRLQRRIEEL